MSRTTTTCFGALALFLVLFPLALAKPGLPLTLKGDEPAYYLMALSLAHDRDLRCEVRDIERLADEFPYNQTQNLILGSSDGWHTLYFGKPYLVSFLAALPTALFGASVGANIFLVGYAYQLGAIPLARASIERAIELNGEAVDMNKAAFEWGRRAVVEPAVVEALVKPAPDATSDARTLSQSFDEVVARRVAFLTAYQNAAYAARYRRLVEKTRAAETARAPGKTGLADAVARYLFKLMAYKDEYEVARLYSDGAFVKQVNSELGGEHLRFHVHLAPPLLARRDKATGEPKKMTFGPWIFPLFSLLAKFKVLRGTAFDPFGYSTERKTERALVSDYEALLDEVLAKLDAGNHHVAVGLAAIPEKIRGFGHVKMRHLKAAKADEAVLLDQFRAGPAPLLKAAE
jgi:indolepyruvate ferredoxin oxidoreductase